jgi:PHD/YefM family antitoxin component YafN of YafNO toxin-antitoxin module
MEKAMPMVEARKRLTTLPEEMAKESEPGVVAVTRRGKPVLAVMPWDLYEGLMETVDIMADAEFMAQLRQSIKQMREGQTVPWEEVERELDRL